MFRCAWNTNSGEHRRYTRGYIQIFCCHLKRCIWRWAEGRDLGEVVLHASHHSVAVWYSVLYVILADSPSMWSIPMPSLSLPCHLYAIFSSYLIPLSPSFSCSISVQTVFVCQYFLIFFSRNVFFSLSLRDIVQLLVWTVVVFSDQWTQEFMLSAL